MGVSTSISGGTTAGRVFDPYPLRPTLGTWCCTWWHHRAVMIPELTMVRKYVNRMGWYHGYYMVTIYEVMAAWTLGSFWCLFPTCQVRVTRFYQSDAWGGHPHPHPPRPPPPPRASVSPAAGRSGHCRTSCASSRSQWALRDFICQLQIAVGTAGPHVRAPDPSGQRRTSTASSRSQWALPDLMCELQIPVGNAGPQPRAPDPSGQRRTSTASSRSQWATPDLNGELPIPVGNAGPQLRGPHPSGQRRTSTASSDRISDRMPDRMSDRMSERMAERYAR